MKKYLNGFISSIFLIIVLCANAFAQPYNLQNENRIKPDTIIYKESSKKIDKKVIEKNKIKIFKGLIIMVEL